MIHISGTKYYSRNTGKISYVGGGWTLKTQAKGLPLMTPKRQAILDLFREREAKKEFPPSCREIAAQVGGKSVSTIYSHLCALYHLGYLEHGLMKSPGAGREKGFFYLANTEVTYELTLQQIRELIHNPGHAKSILEPFMEEEHLREVLT